MIGYRWGYWSYPNPPWVWPPSHVDLYSQAFDSYSEGTCENFSVLDQRLANDEDLRENIIVSLYDDPQIPRSDKERIMVEVQDKVARLSGVVRYRQSKLQAYLNALGVVGIADVRNEIKLKELT
jgi:osmotically-inducible protein OsmY